MGAWIEIIIGFAGYQYIESHPLWVRGLKYNYTHCHDRLLQVAPFVGAWIEIRPHLPLLIYCIVAPFVGAWIEI